MSVEAASKITSQRSSAGVKSSTRKSIRWSAPRRPNSSNSSHTSTAVALEPRDLATGRPTDPTPPPEQGAACASAWGPPGWPSDFAAHHLPSLFEESALGWAPMNDVDYPWGSMHWLAGHRGQQASTLSVAKMILRPGARNERHMHASCDEVMFVVRGTVRHELESKNHVQRAGEWLLVPRGTRHSTENVGAEDAELFVTYGAPERDYVAAPE